MDTITLDRFRGYVDISETGCWEWIGGKAKDGYGRFWDEGKVRLAHRVSYEHYVGKIVRHLTVDHLCMVRRCVNPDHLEAVSLGDNILRGEGVAAINAKKTHCPRGHKYDSVFRDKTTGRVRGRRCLLCHRVAERKRREGNSGDS